MKNVTSMDTESREYRVEIFGSRRRTGGISAAGLCSCAVTAATGRDRKLTTVKDFGQAVDGMSEASDSISWNVFSDNVQ
jgi:hypothetical protein